MARTLIFNILLVITFEVFMFLNGQKKYRGYVTFKHCFKKELAHIVMSLFLIFMKNYCSVYVKNKKNT